MILTQHHDHAVDDNTVYMSNNYIKLHGKKNSDISVHMQSINSRSWSVTINVTLDECPLGFHYPSNDNNVTVCECSTSTPDELYGITDCDSEQLVAHLNPQLTLYNVFPTQTTHPPHRALSCPKPPFHHTELYSQHNMTMTIQVQHSKLSLLHNMYNMYTVILLAIAQVYNLEGYGQTSGIIGHAG